MYKFRLSLTLLVAAFFPITTLASDSHIPAVVVDTISSQAPGASANYTIRFSTEFGIAAGGSMLVRVFPVDSAGALGDSTASGFDFSSTTFSSETIIGSGSAVGAGTEYSISFPSSVPSGEQSFTLSNIVNSATEGDYALGLSVTMNPTANDFTTSDSFAITADPCASIITTEFTEITATAFGTNAIITRSDAVSDAAVSYALVYATSQEAIDTDTATTADMTTVATTTVQDLLAKTLYYFQVRALDSNNCVLEQTTVTATTEKTLSGQRYSKPRVKKIKRTSALVKWSGDDFVETYDMQLWSKNKLKKTFKNLIKLQKALDKKFLNPTTKYEVRVRANYTTGETTRWSKNFLFTTKE